jgi:UDP-N-acetylmuramate dehydrogenase
MALLNSHAKDLSRLWKGEILWDSPMARYSSLKVGGPAEAILFAEHQDELTGLVGWLHENNISWRVIGRGSNILVPDEGLQGVVILLDGEFTTFETLDNLNQPHDDTVRVRAGAGCLLAKLVRHCIAESYSGLEFAVGIPGSVGGAIVMNAGAWHHEIGELIDSVTVMDKSGTVTTEKKENLGLKYRKWGMDPETILLFATFILSHGDKHEIESKCKKYHELRKQQQPLDRPSAGSFFKNPSGHAAGRLIEEVGLKGFTVGGAMISDQHANFIINTGNATASDILTLMREAQARVLKQFGIKLEPEVHILEVRENRT